MLAACQPPGETVPLLQVIPSKTNEERLLLVTPELASVLASVISRLRRRYHGTVPLVARYDSYECLTSPRLPHLFQRDYGSGPTVTGTPASGTGSTTSPPGWD